MRNVDQSLNITDCRLDVMNIVMMIHSHCEDHTKYNGVVLNALVHFAFIKGLNLLQSWWKLGIIDQNLTVEAGKLRDIYKYLNICKMYECHCFCGWSVIYKSWSQQRSPNRATKLELFVANILFSSFMDVLTSCKDFFTHPPSFEDEDIDLLLKTNSLFS